MKKKYLVMIVGLFIILPLVFLTYYFFNLFTSKGLPGGKEVKASHFIDSTPGHGDVYSTSPINITINFDFDLIETSSINMISAGTNYDELTVGSVQVTNNSTTLQKELKPSIRDDTYQVTYKACFKNNKCSDGMFFFTIDSGKRAEYKDFRGKKDVTVDMKELKFLPEKILISPGTKVIWKNLDQENHYVNTETHPAHSYFTIQNSSKILTGQEFSASFTKEGQYNYHCSAHFPQHMVGSILVSK